MRNRKHNGRQYASNLDPGSCSLCGLKRVFVGLGITGDLDYARGSYVVYECPKGHETTTFIGKFDRNNKFIEAR